MCLYTSCTDAWGRLLIESPMPSPLQKQLNGGYYVNYRQRQHPVTVEHRQCPSYVYTVHLQCDIYIYILFQHLCVFIGACQWFGAGLW